MPTEEQYQMAANQMAAEGHGNFYRVEPVGAAGALFS